MADDDRLGGALGRALLQHELGLLGNHAADLDAGDGDAGMDAAHRREGLGGREHDEHGRDAERNVQRRPASGLPRALGGTLRPALGVVDPRLVFVMGRRFGHQY